MCVHRCTFGVERMPGMMLEWGEFWDSACQMDEVPPRHG